jgi:hypothetical protein
MKLDVETLKRARPDVWDKWRELFPKSKLSRDTLYRLCVEAIEKRPDKILTGIFPYLDGGSTL